MEFWISRSLFTNFSFSRWNSGYQEAFSQTFLFHDGILAIRKPFHELFFFTMEFWLSRSVSHNIIHKMQELGEDTLHIYRKEYLHMIRLVKNLALDLEPPLQEKEYGPSYS
jgi:hypothetical protein